MIDINTCSQAEIRKVLCVRGLADRIIKYRRLNGCYRNFNELRRVCGATNIELHDIARHFRIGDLPFDLDLRRPQTQTGSTYYSGGSVADFVCTGKSLSYNLLNGEPQESIAPGVTRSGLQYRRFQEKKENTSMSQEDKFPAAFKLAQKYEKGLIKKRYSNDLKKVENMIKPRHKSAEIGHRDNFLEHIEADERRCKSGKLVSTKSGSMNGPAIKLQTTSSGDKINFSCTIDKQLLKQSSSVAFHLDKNVPVVTKESDVKNPPATKEATLTSVPEASSGEREHDSICTCASSKLSEENLLLHEKTAMPSRADRKAIVEAWVVRVNMAKNLEAVHKRKRSPIAGRRGKRTVSPPVKKLLRRYGLDNNATNLDQNVPGISLPECETPPKNNIARKKMFLCMSERMNKKSNIQEKEKAEKVHSPESSTVSEHIKHNFLDDQEMGKRKESVKPADTKNLTHEQSSNNNNILPKLDSGGLTQQVTATPANIDTENCERQDEKVDLDPLDAEEGCYIM